MVGLNGYFRISVNKAEERVKRSPNFFVIFIAVCVGAGLFQTSKLANSYYLDRAQEAGRATLLLVGEAVDQAVGRFAPIPGLIAGEPVFRQLLQASESQGIEPFVNERLRQIAISIEASEVYVMDRSGLTVATSNYRDEDSFLGQNFAYRPYFIQALAGKSSVFHALGISSGERGFFFSAPILEGIEVVGVLVVKTTVGALEKDWQEIGHEILIADSNGIVFMTNREDFKFRALAPLTQAARANIADSVQYPLERVLPIGLSSDVIRPSTVQVTIAETLSTDRFLAASAPLDFPGWHAIVFTPIEPVQGQVFKTVALGAITMTALLLSALLVLQRRARILERIRFEQDQRVRLEDRVLERTTDLNSANASLRKEVAERRLAEEQLRQSQKELVQAGKLAALGQMSAAISHEINQPLAAIKSYAVNAAEYLARSRVDDAKKNIESISTMSDRMTQISNHLRNFARQPGDQLRPVSVPEVIDETIGLVSPQLRAQGAKIVFTPPQEDVWAIGGKLRLQQVLVNIVANALEAMIDHKAPTIEIILHTTQDRIEIAIRDHGPGVPNEDLEQLFEAFYTTKTTGMGMGLGMSISQNIISDFGGTLSVGNHADGGAIFTVSLQRSEKMPQESVAS